MEDLISSSIFCFDSMLSLNQADAVSLWWRELEGLPLSSCIRWPKVLAISYYIRGALVSAV